MIFSILSLTSLRELKVKNPKPFIFTMTDWTCLHLAIIESYLPTGYFYISAMCVMEGVLRHVLTFSLIQQTIVRFGIYKGAYLLIFGLQWSKCHASAFNTCYSDVNLGRIVMTPNESTNSCEGRPTKSVLQGASTWLRDLQIVGMTGLMHSLLKLLKLVLQ